jgi:hypothetical protein
VCGRRCGRHRGPSRPAPRTPPGQEVSSGSGRPGLMGRSIGCP